MDLEEVDMIGPNKADGSKVVSTSPKTFAFLARHLPRDCSKFTFIDVGSGYGRPLLLAQRYGFRKYIGVEFVTIACDLARRNIAGFLDRQGRLEHFK